MSLQDAWRRSGNLLCLRHGMYRQDICSRLDFSISKTRSILTTVCAGPPSASPPLAPSHKTCDRPSKQFLPISRWIKRICWKEMIGFSPLSQSFGTLMNLHGKYVNLFHICANLSGSPHLSLHLCFHFSHSFSPLQLSSPFVCVHTHAHARVRVCTCVSVFPTPSEDVDSNVNWLPSQCRIFWCPGGLAWWERHSLWNQISTFLPSWKVVSVQSRNTRLVPSNPRLLNFIIDKTDWLRCSCWQWSLHGLGSGVVCWKSSLNDLGWGVAEFEALLTEAKWFHLAQGDVDQ